ncbi:MAG: hypothetical protein CMM93_08615 [Rickettsiales bacterium]|nr:hypothetical protein [Rickettsiales bacterium]
METTVHNKPYPGMLNTGIEFFKHDNNVNLLHNGQTVPFSSTPYAVMKIVEEALEADTQAKQVLEQMVKGSRYNVTEKFVWCRFGGLDFTSDLEDGMLQDGEFHACDQRGKCPGEGIVCKMPIYKGTRLTKQMVHLMALLCTTMTNETIAYTMGLPFGSYHQLKKKLYSTLGGVQTKQEVALIARSLNVV